MAAEPRDLVPFAPAAIDAAAFFNPEQMSLIKRQIAPKATDDELKLFLYQAARTGLDPLSRQIYAIHRNEYDPDTREKKPKMTIQTSIDGLRLIAERTGRYAPGPETTFEYDGDGKLRKATAYVKKRTADGQWHTVAASAHFWEYAQVYNEKPTRMWAEKPHIMLSKCAEALALRKAFPAEMSNLYTSDEMSKDAEPEYTPPPPQTQVTPEVKAALAGSKSNRAPAKAIAPVAAQPPANETHPAVEAAKAAFPGAVEREPGSDDDVEAPAAAPEKVVVYRWSDEIEQWMPGPSEPKRTAEQNSKLHALKGELKITGELWRKNLLSWFGKASSGDLSVGEASQLIEDLETEKAKREKAKSKEVRK